MLESQNESIKEITGKITGFFRDKVEVTLPNDAKVGNEYIVVAEKYLVTVPKMIKVKKNFEYNINDRRNVTRVSTERAFWKDDYEFFSPEQRAAGRKDGGRKSKKNNAKKHKKRKFTKRRKKNKRKTKKRR